MDVQLEPHEARVLGVLIEKSLTTPENYPLSLNATTNGANQKSNRDPVLSLLEGEVYAALRGLIRKGLVGASHDAGGRVEKFRHNGETMLEVDTAQLATLAELMMRGAQMPGELRTRAHRMAPIETQARLMEVLAPLLERGLVQRLPPAAGSRAERYGQCLSSDAQALAASPAAAAPAPAPVPVPSASREPAPTPVAAGSDGDARLAPRVDELEAEVARLKRQLRNLAWQLDKKLEG